MKIGVLETGAPPADLRERYGRYGAMFQTLVGDKAHEWTLFDVAAGDLPAKPEVCEAYLITGSAAGVYDPDPWIARTEGFLRAARGRALLVGICFGHQLMAQAFGGRVIKSPKGWGIGLHRYEVRDRLPWMDGAATLAAPASHQDQVVEPPPGAAVLAGSDFTPFGMLAYEGGDAMSLQLHPEFEPGYAKALIEARRGTRYAPADADRAIASLDASPDERARLGHWIGNFLDP
ncbi:MAG: type 1 glutamine amidotransferase [Caulobacteraceae bacterium]|nr:type 1 glutamine amidotransferase [Caulobacteraceae bacterium]